MVSATLPHRGCKLCYRDGLGKACDCAISVSQRFDVLLVIASNRDHGEIFPTHVNRTEQGHAVCTVVEIDNGKITMSTQPADYLQRVAGIISKMTNTAIFGECLSHSLFQLRIVCEEKDDWCFHIVSMTVSLLRRSTTIAI